MFVSCGPIWDCEGSYLWIGEGDVVDIEDECKHVTRPELRCLTSAVDRTLGEMVEHPFASGLHRKSHMISQSYSAISGTHVTSRYALFVLLLVAFLVCVFRDSSSPHPTSTSDCASSPVIDWDDNVGKSSPWERWSKEVVTWRSVLNSALLICVALSARSVAVVLGSTFWVPLVVAAVSMGFVAYCMHENEPLFSWCVAIVACIQVATIPVLAFWRLTPAMQCVTVMLLVIAGAWIFAFVGYKRRNY